MNTIEKKIKKLQDENKATKKLMRSIANLPEPYLTCWQNSKLCEFTIMYKFKTVEEVKNIVEQWNEFILPLVLHKGTFTQFKTPMHKEEKGTSTPVFSVTVDVSKYDFEFEFYALVNGHLLNVSIESEFGHYPHQLARVSWQNHSNRYGDKWVTDVFCHADGFDNPKKIKWASGSPEYPNSFTLYWENVDSFEEIFK